MTQGSETAVTDNGTTTENASSTTQTTHSSRREGRPSSGHRGRTRERQRHVVINENATTTSTESEHNSMSEPPHTGDDGQENTDSDRELPSHEGTSDQHSQQADNVEELVTLAEPSELTATQLHPMSSPTQEEVEAIEAFISRLELLTPVPSLPNSSDMVDDDFSEFVSSEAPPSSV